MSPVSNKELNRQFRVLDQLVGMHSILRDRYGRWALLADLLLLACAVVFCATTFGREYISTRLNVSTEVVADVLGLASIIAFFAALGTLVINWKGRSAQHEEAVKALTNGLALFREAKENGDWSSEHRDSLNQAYWTIMKNVVPIPQGKFVSLKVRHLRKVEISRAADTLGCCPLSLIRIIVLCRSFRRVFGIRARMQREKNDHAHRPIDHGGAVSRSEGGGD